MQLISSIQDFRSWRKGLIGPIGFVPTMGALHSGHLSLVKKSIIMCDYTVVSIFLNPKQFNVNEDLDTYPKNIEEDISQLSNYKVDCIFIPDNLEIYPLSFNTVVNTKGISEYLEGKSRPHFFQGVTTIVSKLFNIIEPSHAFFGEKDIQQLKVIEKMVDDLNYPILIIACPTVREKNGLAMSSRNQYLTNIEFQSASIIYDAIKSGYELLNEGEKNPQIVREKIKNVLSKETCLAIDYVSISDRYSLEEISLEINDDIIISIAVYIGKVRLIDNMIFKIPNKK